MTKRIYVGNLSYDTTEAKLNELFAAIGTVNAVNLITEPGTGRSKGFAFVEMADDEQAAAAINQLNEHEVDGRKLKVAEARPKPEGSGRTGGGFRDRRDSRDSRGGGGGGGDRGGRRPAW